MTIHLKIGVVINILSSFPTIILVLSNYIISSANGNTNCLESIPDAKLFRLQRTRFYIVQPTLLFNGIEWEDTKKVCSNYGLNLASVDSYGVDAVIGNGLERFAKDNAEFRESMQFWIDGKYNPTNASYIWVREKKLLGFHKIIYQGERPIGFGNDLSADGNIFNPEIKDLPEMCLSYQIKFTDNLENPLRLGYETSMTEVPCKPKLQTISEKRFALCEGDPIICPNPERNNASIFTDTKNYYMYEGNWIFGIPRKYVLNWLPRKISEAKSYCESKGLKLYRPDNKEKCLIQFLVLWNKRISTGAFWTDLKSYVPRSTLHSDKTLDICMATKLNLENRGNDDCSNHQKDSSALFPANCDIKMATICIHGDTNTEMTNNEIQDDDTCSCKNVWGINEDISKLLYNAEGRQRIINRTHTVPFGSEDADFWLYRSTYKQKFGPRICPTQNKEYGMVYEVTELPLPNQIKSYKYDVDDEYWVRDFTHGLLRTGTNCKTTFYSPAQGKWAIKDGVDCDEFHFYLCARKSHRGRRSVDEEMIMSADEPAINLVDWF